MLKRFFNGLWRGDFNFFILTGLFLMAVLVDRPANAADVFMVGMFLFHEIDKRGFRGPRLHP